MKTCRVCGQLKPLDDFHWRVVAKGTRMSSCKVCANAKAAVWRAQDPERRDANNRRYYAENRETLRVKRQERRHSDPETHREYDRRYYAQHREAHLAYTLRKRRENPERHVAYDHKRRSALGDVGVAEVEYIAVLRNDPCTYCGGTTQTIDHIEPLSSGGNGGWENLTASCRGCNAKKGAIALLAFLGRVRN